MARAGRTVDAFHPCEVMPTVRRPDWMEQGPSRVDADDVGDDSVTAGL
jgi:hypothetical protein